MCVRKESDAKAQTGDRVQLRSVPKALLTERTGLELAI
jgi:hypothetical protein